MFLYWTIRYLDSAERRFKTRRLYLRTKELDHATRAAVELCYERGRVVRSREMLRFRHLFRAVTDLAEVDRMWREDGGLACASLPHDYVEDEDGRELRWDDVGRLLTGEPNVLLCPPGMKPHDIRYAMSDKRPIDPDTLTVSDEDLRSLSYFARDLTKLSGSSFFKEGPGALTSRGGEEPQVRSAVSDEEITSFVAVFRRLYMKGDRKKGDPGTFEIAVRVFRDVVKDHPVADWVGGVFDEYERDLSSPPALLPGLTPACPPFDRKKLVECFIYTQYAHQPNDKREREYRECLAAVGGRSQTLFWLFLTEMHALALHYVNAGRQIEYFLDWYCRHRRTCADVLTSAAAHGPGIGREEKREDRLRRLHEERVRRLAADLWEEAGRPGGGPDEFVAEAEDRLWQALG